MPLLWTATLLACTQPGPDIAPEPVTSGESPADAAEVFLRLLSAEERALAVLDYDSPRRADWSTLPASLVDPVRPGLRFGDMTEEQLGAALALVDTLSESGAGVVRQIIAADNVLQPRDVRRLGWSTANYWLALYGDPTLPPWGYGLSGHHLGLNVSTDGAEYTLSPTFLGVEPARFELDGTEYAPLRPYADRALALMAALSAEQRDAATIAERPEEVLAGPGEDRRVPDIEGIDVGRLSPDQQDMLLDLIDLWTGVLADGQTVELTALHFAWNGPTDGSEPIYFRIQGSNLLIEYSTEAAVDDPDGPVHSVFRVPSNQYGLDW